MAAASLGNSLTAHPVSVRALTARLFFGVADTGTLAQVAQPPDFNRCPGRAEGTCLHLLTDWPPGALDYTANKPHTALALSMGPLHTRRGTAVRELDPGAPEVVLQQQG